MGVINKNSAYKTGCNPNVRQALLPVHLQRGDPQDLYKSNPMLDSEVTECASDLRARIVQRPSNTLGHTSESQTIQSKLLQDQTGDESAWILGPLGFGLVEVMQLLTQLSIGFKTLAPCQALSLIHCDNFDNSGKARY